MTDSDSSSSEDSEFHWLKFSPKKANESNSFFPEDISNFMNALKKYLKETKVKALKLKSQGLKSAEVMSILELLTHSYSKVTELNLDCNNFESGMQETFKTFTKTKLKKLSVSFSKLPKDDFMCLLGVLKDSKITNLDVSCSGIELNIYETSKLTSHLLASRVTHLDYGANTFLPATGALTFVYALPYTSITCLDLTECSLHHEVIISLFSNVHRTKITDLNVCDNQVTDEQVKELGPNLKASKLEKLDLSCNSITDTGIDILATGLIGSVVIELNIACNKFLGKNFLGHSLKNTKIRVLTLCGNDIEDCEMFSFPDFLKGSSVSTLDIGNCRLGDEIGQKLMRSLKFSNLNEFFVNGNELGSLSLSEFVKNVNDTKIVDVDFSENALRFPDVVSFTECLKNSSLECIYIGGNFLFPMGSEAVPFLLRETIGSSVTTMDVGVNETSESGAEAVATLLSDLTISDLRLYSNEIEDGVLSLAAALKFSSLTRLDLNNNKINNIGAEALGKCLKETLIVELNISENVITSQGASALALGLKDSNVLHLDLSKNKIGNEGFQALAEHARNTFITFLDVSHNPGNRIFLVETVLWENRISKHFLVSFFTKIAPASDEVLFHFDHIMNNFNGGAFLEDVLLFCKTLERPIAVTVLSEEESIRLSKSEIVDLMEEFPRQFSVFVASRIKGTVSQYVSVLRQAEELELSKIVESLLLNRPTYTIDESQGVLHPYVYKLLFKYKQPLYNLSVEPLSKVKIINYFTNHTEYSDALDVIRMLQN